MQHKTIFLFFIFLPTLAMEQENLSVKTLLELCYAKMPAILNYYIDQLDNNADTNQLADYLQKKITKKLPSDLLDNTIEWLEKNSSKTDLKDLGEVIAISPHDHYWIIKPAKKTYYLLNRATGNKDLLSANESIYYASFSPDERYCIVQQCGKLKLYQTTPYKFIKTIKNFNCGMSNNNLIFLDKSLFIYKSGGNQIMKSSIQQKKRTTVLKENNDDLFRIFDKPDRFATINFFANKINIYNLQSNLLHAFSVSDHVDSLITHTRNKILSALFLDGKKIYLWKFNSDYSEIVEKNVTIKPRKRVSSNICFDPTGLLLIHGTSKNNPSLIFYDIWSKTEIGEILFVEKYPVTAVVCKSDGSIIKKNGWGHCTAIDNRPWAAALLKALQIKSQSALHNAQTTSDNCNDH